LSRRPVVLLAMTNTSHQHHSCHREPLVGVAIHCEPENEETSRTPPPRHDGLPRRSLLLPPRNDKHHIPFLHYTFVIASPSWAWRSTVPSVTEPPTPSALLEHDGLPRRSLPLPPRNDKVCCHREGASPWRSTVNQKTKGQTRPPIPRDTMDCRVVHSVLLAMKK
jgi:hypothetical protein